MPVTLYHASVYNNISSINSNGLRASTRGRLGQGVYLTTQSEAKTIAKHRQKQNNQSKWVVFKVRADLGDCKDNGSNNDTRGLWENTHDSCVGMHPGWEVPGMSAFREWCVPADRCTVIDYETGSDGASFKSTPSYDSFKSTPSYNEPEPQKPQIQENHFMVIDGMGIPNVFAEIGRASCRERV